MTQNNGDNVVSKYHLWRVAFIVVGVLISTIGYLIERRLASIEDHISTLDNRVDIAAAKSESNSDLLKYLYNAVIPKGP
jgi:hypothetical protein